MKEEEEKMLKKDFYTTQTEVLIAEKHLYGFPEFRTLQKLTRRTGEGEERIF